jgi:hypothetical protein
MKKACVLTVLFSKYFFVALLVFFFSHQQIKGQSRTIDIASYNGNSKELKDLQKLVTGTVSFAENLLRKKGTFPPYSSALMATDRIAMVGTFLGSDDPASKMAIDNIKAGLKENTKKWKHKAVAVYYPVNITDAGTNEKTDAIAVLAEHRYGNSAYIFYYPYKISATREVTFSTTFGYTAKKEFFITGGAKKDTLRKTDIINK